MPTYEIVVDISRNLDNKEEYSVEELNELIPAAISASLNNFITYTADVKDIHQVRPLRPSEDTTDLDQIIIPLPDLRMLIVQLLKDGFTEAPLGQLLLMIRSLYRNADENPNQSRVSEGLTTPR